MTVGTYQLPGKRPLAPSEAEHDLAVMGRRVIGGTGGGALIGAGTGRLVGGRPGAAVGAGVGAGLGALHGALRGREDITGDRTTQERMAMRDALGIWRRHKKELAKQKAKQSSVEDGMELSGATLRAMTDELMALRKEAAEKEKVAILGAIGRGVIGLGRRAASGLAKRAPNMMGKLPQHLETGLVRGSEAMGGGIGGAHRLAKTVGGVTLGAAALPVGAAYMAGRGSQR